MNAFCTYCSASKSRETGTIPAIQRYKSARIDTVYAAAQKLGVDFYILSGKFGLISAQRLIPYYDQLLTNDDVPALAEQVKQQLLDHGLDSVVYYTQPLSSSARLLPYSAVLRTACVEASVRYLLVELEEKEGKEEEKSVTGWIPIMKAADSIKNVLIEDRPSGEREFRKFLAHHAGDGMVYFKRAEAYEVIGENELAASDYRRALVQFPKQKYKDLAKAGLERITAQGRDDLWKKALMDVASQATGNEEKFSAFLRTLSLDNDLPLNVGEQLTIELKMLLRLPKDDKSQNLDSLIREASRRDLLPNGAADMAHLIRKQRNMVAHPSPAVSKKTLPARTILCLFAAALLWPELPE